MQSDLTSKFEEDQPDWYGKTSRPAIDLTDLNDEPPRKVHRGTSDRKGSKSMAPTQEKTQKEAAPESQGEVNEGQGIEVVKSSETGGQPDDLVLFRFGTSQFVSVVKVMQSLEAKIRVLTGPLGTSKTVATTRGGEGASTVPVEGVVEDERLVIVIELLDWHTKSTQSLLAGQNVILDAALTPLLGLVRALAAPLTRVAWGERRGSGVSVDKQLSQALVVSLQLIARLTSLCLPQTTTPSAAASGRQGEGGGFLSLVQESTITLYGSDRNAEYGPADGREG